MNVNKRCRISDPREWASEEANNFSAAYNCPPHKPLPLSLLHLPLEIRYMIYSYTYSNILAISCVYNTPSAPETWLSDRSPTADEGELIRLRSPYQITGLHHTCRQLSRETAPFNPLFKSIEGDAMSLFRFLSRPAPNPLLRLRAVTICLRTGDTEFRHGKVALAPHLEWVIWALSKLGSVRRVSVEGCVSLFDAEEHAAFAAIWGLLSQRVLGEGGLDVVSTPSKWFGGCFCCGLAACRCLTSELWADCVTVVERRI